MFDVSINSVGIGSLLLTLVIGAASLSALGLALTSIIPSESAAPAITNAIVLPLYFISDVFIVGQDKSERLQTIANIFPIQHLASALHESFDPFVTSTPWPWDHWLVIGAWGLGGGLITLVTFRWTPNR